MAHEKIIGTWTDPLGRKVALTFQQWNEHVLVRHAHMVFMLDEIGRTIKKPELILRQKVTRLYFRKGFHLGRMFDLKVVVRWILGDFDDVGFVVTAHRIRKRNQEGVLEWQKA